VRCYEMVARALLLSLMLGLLLLMSRGIVGSFIRLLEAATLTEAILKEELIRALTLLAVFEVHKTVQTYFVFGRVKVTAVLETVLVALLTELLALWFKAGGGWELFLATGAVLVLLFARIVAIRFSPDAPQVHQELRAASFQQVAGSCG
jgi:uncharacterized membrane protein (DUF373 family)